MAGRRRGGGRDASRQVAFRGVDRSAAFAADGRAALRARSARRRRGVVRRSRRRRTRRDRGGAEIRMAIAEACRRRGKSNEAGQRRCSDAGPTDLLQIEASAGAAGECAAGGEDASLAAARGTVRPSDSGDAPRCSRICRLEVFSRRKMASRRRTNRGLDDLGHAGLGIDADERSAVVSSATLSGRGSIASVIAENHLLENSVAICFGPIGRRLALGAASRLLRALNAVAKWKFYAFTRIGTSPHRLEFVRPPARRNYDF